MLVLTRRVGEAIVVDGGVRITVVAIHGNKVRLGVEAPDWVRVDREEVHRRIVDLTRDFNGDDTPLSRATGVDAARLK
jgi:carbon storage regulator